MMCSCRRLHFFQWPLKLPSHPVSKRDRIYVPTNSWQDTMGCSMDGVNKARKSILLGLLLASQLYSLQALAIKETTPSVSTQPSVGRERISINHSWQFKRFGSNPDGLLYDTRPDVAGLNNTTVLKPWDPPFRQRLHSRPCRSPSAARRQPRRECAVCSGHF